MATEAEAAREARAKVISAEGDQKASIALKQAADMINQSPVALQLRYLQTLNSIAAEKNSTIIFPIPMEMLRHFSLKSWINITIIQYFLISYFLIWNRFFPIMRTIFEYFDFHMLHYLVKLRHDNNFWRLFNLESFDNNILLIIIAHNSIILNTFYSNHYFV